MDRHTNATIVFTAPGKVQIQEQDRPAPGPNEVLIRTRQTLISIGTELTILSGEYPPDSYWARYGKFPYYPGYNNIGQIVEIGPGVDNGRLGQRVATYGRHAAYVVCNVEGLRMIPSDVPDEEALFFTFAEIVMNGIRRSRLEWGEAVVMYGLGLLGQMAVQLATVCGARPVFGIDVSDARLRLLPSLCTVIPINGSRDNAAELVKTHTRGRMADVVFEVTGAPALIPQEFGLLRRQGRFVVLSSPRGKTAFDFHDLCNEPSFTIIGAHNTSHPPHASLDYPWTNRRHAELFFDLIADKSLDMKGLISHRGSFGDAARFYEMLSRDRAGAMGIVLNWKV